MIHALTLAAVTSTAGLKPVRTLVYAFSYSTPSEKHQGTIQADVMGITQDGGLIVRLSQQVGGVPAQTFASAECAIYADTRVQCQKAGALGAYENELGHLLGRKFVNGDVMDDKNHWRIQGGAGSGTVTDDFTVTSNVAGIVTIDEARDFTVSGSTTHHTAQITYDLNKTIPTKISYKDSSSAAAAPAVTAEYTLQSDSMAVKP